MGLGLSSNADADDVPHPYRLLEAYPGLFDYVEYSAPLSIDEARAQASLFPQMLERVDEVPLLYHPVHLNLYGPEVESAERIALASQHAQAVRSPWISNDVAWWHREGRPFPGYLYLSPMLDEAAVEECAHHASSLQRCLAVPLALENPICTFPLGPMHVLDFMAALHRRTGLPLLLDLGHLFAYQLARGLPVDEGIDRFPLDQVIEIHVAGGVVTGRFYADDHTQPVREELFSLLERILPRCTRLRALTFEGDGHPDEVAVRTLKRLRALLAPRPDPVRLPSPPEPPPRPAGMEERCRRRFDAAFASPADEGEHRYRLAVLAQTIDRAFPLTRLLLAGSPEGMAQFARSDAFRSVYQPNGRPVLDAFATWSRARARDAGDEAVNLALAFETWARGAARRHAEPVGPNRLALSAGVMVGTFTADLGEAVFAARALRRHLQRRAWAGGVEGSEAAEPLRQVLMRAARRPWTVAIRVRGEAVEVSDQPALLKVLEQAAAGRTLEEARSVAGAAVDEAVARGWVRAGELRGDGPIG